MPRLPRYVLPGHPQHIILRGHNHIPIFVTNYDYESFYEYVREACEKYQCNVHAWMLMQDHVHILMTPFDRYGITKTMRTVGQRYSQYFNSEYRRTGTLWDGRYKATLVDPDGYALTCCQYIELNAVRANITTNPGEYRWSSYHANALGYKDDLVKPHDSYLMLGETPKERQQKYRTKFLVDINIEVIDEIRRSTQNGWVLGGKEYKLTVERLLRRRTEPLPRGGDRRSSKFLEKVRKEP